MDKTADALVDVVTGERADPPGRRQGAPLGPNAARGPEPARFVDFGVAFIEFAAGLAWKTAYATPACDSTPVAPLVAARVALDEAETEQVSGNMAMAAQLAALARLIAVAREHPELYLTEEGMQARDAVEFAERAAALDASLRLNLDPDQVRNRAHEARVLAESLPQLWAVFQAGETGYSQASAAVQLLTGLTDPAAITEYDTKLAGRAGDLTPGAFRQKARRLAERLRAEPSELRHTRALSERRVAFEYVADGMAWIHAFVPAAEAVCITRLLDAEAKKVAKKEAKIAAKAGIAGGPLRTRDQIRADRFVDILARKGTPQEVKVRVVLHVPMLELLEGPGGRNSATEAGRSEGRPNQPILRRQSAVLEGYGPIDPVTAAQLFINAPSFGRVVTDPFSGEILNFDRRRYRPTKAQREYIAMKYGTCATPGCNRLAATSDVDHLKEWARDNGFTNEDNLIPLCPSDHRLKTLTKIRYKREPDGTVIVTTPTGTVGRRKTWKPLPDNPPF